MRHPEEAALRPPATALRFFGEREVSPAGSVAVPFAPVHGILLISINIFSPPVRQVSSAELPLAVLILDGMVSKVVRLFFLLLPLGLQGQLIYRIGGVVGGQYSRLRSDVFVTSSGQVAPLVGFAFLVRPRPGGWEVAQEVVLTRGGAYARAVYFRAEQPPEEHLYLYAFYTFETSLWLGVRPLRHFPLRLQVGGFLGGNFDYLRRRQRELMVGHYENINRAIRAVELNDAFSGMDFGPAVGVAVGEGRLRVGGRYYIGARNLYRYLDFAPSGPYIRTSALRVSLTCFLK
jgi:hypothetical protein